MLENGDIIEKVINILINNIIIEELIILKEERLEEILRNANKLEINTAPNILSSTLKDIGQFRVQFCRDRIPDPNFLPARFVNLPDN